MAKTADSIPLAVQPWEQVGSQDSVLQQGTGGGGAHAYREMNSRGRESGCGYWRSGKGGSALEARQVRLVRENLFTELLKAASRELMTRGPQHEQLWPAAALHPQRLLSSMGI